MSADLDSLLKAHPDEFTVLPNGRLQCSLTGHEMVAQREALAAYLQSKSYKAARLEKDLKQFEPHIVQSPEYSDKLLCTLTGTLLNKKEEAVWKHMMGKKFQKGLALKEEGGSADKAEVPAGKRKLKQPKAVVVEEADAMQEDDPEASEGTGQDSGGAFWQPPLGFRRDEDRGEELAMAAGSGMDVTTRDAEALLDSPGSEDEDNSMQLDERGKHQKLKRKTQSVGPASNAPRKKKGRPKP